MKKLKEFRKRTYPLVIPITHYVYIGTQEYIVKNLAVSPNDSRKLLERQLGLLLLQPIVLKLVRDEENSKKENASNEGSKDKEKKCTLSGVKDLVKYLYYSSIAFYTFITVLEEELRINGLSNENFAVMYNTLAKVSRIPEEIYGVINTLANTALLSYTTSEVRKASEIISDVFSEVTKIDLSDDDEVIDKVIENISKKPIEQIENIVFKVRKEEDREKIKEEIRSVLEQVDNPSMPLFGIIPIIQGNLREHKTFSQVQIAISNSIRTILGLAYRAHEALKIREIVEGRSEINEDPSLIEKKTVISAAKKVYKYSKISFFFLFKDEELEVIFSKFSKDPASLDDYTLLKLKIALRIFFDSIKYIYGCTQEEYGNRDQSTQDKEKSEKKTKKKGRSNISDYSPILHKAIIIPIEDSLENYQRFISVYTDIRDLAGRTTIFTDNRDESRVTAHGKPELIRIKLITKEYANKLTGGFGIEIRDVIGIGRFIIPQTLIGVYRGYRIYSSPMYYMFCAVDTPLSALSIMSVAHGLIPVLKFERINKSKSNEFDPNDEYRVYVLDMFDFSSGPCPHNPARTIVMLRGYIRKLQMKAVELFGLEGIDEFNKAVEEAKEFLKEIIPEKVFKELANNPLETLSAAILTLHALITLNIFANVSPTPLNSSSSEIPRLHIEKIAKVAREKLGLEGSNSRFCLDFRTCPMSLTNQELYATRVSDKMPAISSVIRNLNHPLIKARFGFFKRVVSKNNSQEKHTQERLRIFVRACATGSYASNVYVLAAVSGAKLIPKKPVVAAGWFDAKTTYMETCLQNKSIIKRLLSHKLKREVKSADLPDVIEEARNEINEGKDIDPDKLPKPTYKIHLLGSHSEYLGEKERMKNVLLDRRLFGRRIEETIKDSEGGIHHLLKIINKIDKKAKKLVKSKDDELSRYLYTYSKKDKKGTIKDRPEDISLRIIHDISPKIGALYLVYKGKGFEEHVEQVLKTLNEYVENSLNILEKIDRKASRELEYRIHKLEISREKDQGVYLLVPVPVSSKQGSIKLEREDLVRNAYAPCIKPDCPIQASAPIVALSPSVVRYLIGLAQLLLSGEVDPKRLPVLTKLKGLSTLIKQLQVLFVSLAKRGVKSFPFYVLVEVEKKGDKYFPKRLLGLREGEEIYIETSDKTPTLPYPFSGELQHTLVDERSKELKLLVGYRFEAKTVYDYVILLERLLKALSRASIKLRKELENIEIEGDVEISLYPIPIVAKRNYTYVILRKKESDFGVPIMRRNIHIKGIFAVKSLERGFLPRPIRSGIKKESIENLPKQAYDYYNALTTYFYNSRRTSITTGYDKDVYLYTNNSKKYYEADPKILLDICKDDALYIVLGRLWELYLDTPTVDNVESSILVGTFGPEHTIISLISLDRGVIFSMGKTILWTIART